MAGPQPASDGHKRSFPAHPEFLLRSVHEWQVYGDESEAFVGSTRPGAAAGGRGVLGELKISAAILERLLIEKTFTHLGPQPPPRALAREPVAHHEG